MSDETDDAGYYSSDPESEISVCTDLLQPSLSARLTSSGYQGDDEGSNEEDDAEDDGEVTSAYNAIQEPPEEQESVGEPDPADEGMWMLATGDAGSSTNDRTVREAPNPAPGPSRNLRRSRVYVEDEVQKRARLEEPSASTQ